MSENSESKKYQKRQFDEDQYKMLLRCSEKKDMTEWNEWRKAHEKISVKLEGAKLTGAHLEGANLWEAHLESAELEGAHLEEANFGGAYLEGAKLLGAYLEDTFLRSTNLEGADLSEANLKGAYLWGTNLKGANFSLSRFDGNTLLLNCDIDEETDFTGTGLESARVEPRLKVILQGNIRRKQWEKWYKEGSKLKQQYKKFIVKPFWWVSDYGRSTGRIIGCFFVLSIIFALIYYFCGIFDGQGVIANLFTVDKSYGDFVVPVPINSHIIPIRAIYFSIVTMTTLGFGDMYAQANSYLGHILLTIQVLLGYVLLGALVTRFAILFTSSGPEKK
jgi:Pentapeptide repeats (8 copies)/Ion channel